MGVGDFGYGRASASLQAMTVIVLHGLACHCVALRHGPAACPSAAVRPRLPALPCRAAGRRHDPPMPLPLPPLDTNSKLSN